MHKLIKTNFIYLLFTSLPSIAYAQADVQFVPVEPIGVINTTTTDSYFASLFTIFIVVAVILAVIRLMICGIKYMTSESISSKSAAKTCIQYVIGGLLLALTSYIILETVNEDLVSGSFTKVTDSIQIDATNLNSNIALDGSQFDVDNIVTENRFQLTVRNNCTGNSATFSEPNETMCENTLESVLNIPMWAVVSSCRNDGSGQYTYTIRKNGNGCDRSDIDVKYFPPGGLFEFDATPCNNALEIALRERNYTDSGGGCTDLGPPPGP